jgi:hypothetical protein
VSKTLFSISAPTPSLAILEPVAGQRVEGASVQVVVSTVGTIGYLRAACPEQLTEPVGFACADGLVHKAFLSLVAPLGHKTIRVTAVMGEQVLTAETQIEHQDLVAPAAVPGPPGGGDQAEGSGEP